MERENNKDIERMILDKLKERKGETENLCNKKITETEKEKCEISLGH